MHLIQRRTFESTSTEKMQIHALENADSLAENLGQRITTLLEKAIESRNEAFLVVSGGSTPKPLFHYLSEKLIDWRKVTVILADERCVEPWDAQSNARLVKEHLLQKHASKARFLSLFDGGEPSSQSERVANDRLSSLPKYDAVILGMGDDGHTASIFPSAVNRDSALDCNQPKLALLTDPVTVGPIRITQTARRLLDTRLLCLHITGGEKANLVEKILANPDAKKWPISFFLRQTEVPAEIYQTVLNSE